MKILVVVNSSDKTIAMAANIADSLKKLGAEVTVLDGMSEEASPDYDSIIVLGGDGTLIRAARKYSPYGVPLLGVNMGTVGFLSNLKPEEVEGCLPRLVAGDFQIDERMGIAADMCLNQTVTDSYLCFNEISLKSCLPKMTRIELEINGQKQAVYQGDGLIIATPTGSTAYSLSCGGPVVDPALDAFLITPIASNSMKKRPMVISASNVLRMYPQRYDNMVFSVDGQVKGALPNDTVISIRKADRKVKLINLNGSSFFHTLDERLRRREG